MREKQVKIAVAPFVAIASLCPRAQAQEPLAERRKNHSHWTSARKEGLGSIGEIYDDLGDTQKSLDYYNQGLVLDRAVGNREGEGATLNDMSLIYYKLGETQKALDSCNQVLPLLRATGDRKGEGLTLDGLSRIYTHLGDNQKALVFAKQAPPLFQAIGDDDDAVMTQKAIKWIEQELRKEHAGAEAFR